MKKLILLIIASCLLCTVISCGKIDVYEPNAPATLPPISAEGRNTFGFMFGNEVWTPNLYTTSFPTLSADYSTTGTAPGLNITCRRKNTRSTTFSDNFYLKIKSTNLSAGTYPLSNTNCSVEVDLAMSDNTKREYLFDEGSIDFSRWDLTNKIASGTFTIMVKEKTTGEKIALSDGRFDVKFVY